MEEQTQGKLVLNELISNNAEAAYISKPDVFGEEYDLLIGAFRKYYEKLNIAYSFKTNYLPNFLNVIKEKKGYAEVVSTMELALALKVGFTPENIFFNGPFKHKKETLEYLKLGVLVNVDSANEFSWIEEYAERTKTKCRVGIRLNFNLPDSPSRFGVQTNTGEVQAIIAKCRTSDYLSFESLHCHYAPRKLAMWDICAKELSSFFDTLDKHIIENLKFLSLGGGMFSRMDPYIEEQLPFEIPSFDEYAEKSVKWLSAYFKSKSINTDLEVLIEPGTALASKSVDFAVQVVSIKEIGDYTYINTTGSKYNMNPSPNRINSPLIVFNAKINPTVKVSGGQLCGYTCIETDIIHDDFSGDIAVGDLIIFKEVGAYSVVMKPPFILPDVPVLEFDPQENKYDVIRVQQTVDNIFQNFKCFQK